MQAATNKQINHFNRQWMDDWHQCHWGTAHTPWPSEGGHCPAPRRNQDPLHQVWKSCWWVHLDRKQQPGYCHIKRLWDSSQIITAHCQISHAGGWFRQHNIYHDVFFVTCAHMWASSHLWGEHVPAVDLPGLPSQFPQGMMDPDACLLPALSEFPGCSYLMELDCQQWWGLEKIQSVWIRREKLSLATTCTIVPSLRIKIIISHRTIRFGFFPLNKKHLHCVYLLFLSI